MCAGRKRATTSAEIIGEHYGEEAGIKSGTVLIKGANAYGWLEDRVRRASAGAHLALRLQRAAPHELRLGVGLSGHRRHDRDRDRREGRAHRHLSLIGGGRPARQHHRQRRPLTHLPTGIVVTCQNERSQHKNRATAWKMLRARLYEAELNVGRRRRKPRPPPNPTSASAIRSVLTCCSPTSW